MGIILTLVMLVFTLPVNDKGFSPKEIEIQQGDMVIFENLGNNPHWPASDIHPTHQIRGKIIVKGEEQTDKPQFLSLWDRLINFFTRLFKNESANFKFNQSIQKDAKIIFSNDDLYSYIKKFGPKQTVQRLHELVPEFGDCHQKAHKAGRIAYEIYGGETFQKCSAECHSGCYHGATEAYFREYGAANLTADLNLICGGELNDFFSHQCIHGVGHGLMAYTNYDLKEALNYCDLLDKRQDSCWTGVFMENFVGAVTEKETTKSEQLADKHVSKYLNEDSQYPCNIVDEKYKGPVIFYKHPE